jgi:hypothetical protein
LEAHNFYPLFAAPGGGFIPQEKFGYNGLKAVVSISAAAAMAWLMRSYCSSSVPASLGRIKALPPKAMIIFGYLAESMGCMAI